MASSSAAAAAASSSSSSSPPPAILNSPLLQRSNSLDILTARRCWQKIDAGSSGFVSAHDLQQYLSKFIAQQQTAGAEDATGSYQQSGQRMYIDMDEEEKKGNYQASSSSSSAAAAAASASSSSSALSARARQLCKDASHISPKDLEDLILFAGVRQKGKIELDDLVQAYSCFTNPSVKLTKERFTSEIIDKGIAGARPKQQQQQYQPHQPTGGYQGAAFRAGMGIPQTSTIPSLPSIFATASIPAPASSSSSSAYDAGAASSAANAINLTEDDAPAFPSMLSPTPPSSSPSHAPAAAASEFQM